MGFFKLLTSNWYIFFAAIAEFCVLVKICSRLNEDVPEKLNEYYPKEHIKAHCKKYLKSLSVLYSFFTTIITIFPLLGMFGTVWALINLSEDMQNVVQGEFFNALYSTFFGIIFAVVFKLLNAWISTKVETRIEACEKLIQKEEEEAAMFDSSENWQKIKADENMQSKKSGKAGNIKL